MKERTSWTKAIKSRRGAYIIEASILLPLIVLCVLSFGYFTKVEGIWENCFHCAIDESGKAQAMAWDGLSPLAAKAMIDSRINKESRGPSSFAVRAFIPDYSSGGRDHLSSYTLTAGVHMDLPAGFSRDFEFSAPVLYRGFVGMNIEGDPLGISGLEDGVPGDPAYVFPAFGKKYHDALCTYVKATVHGQRLSPSLKSRYKSCSACHSEDVSNGSLVFCFETSGTAYHRASCRTINRHVIVMDKGEAAEKGYTPCSKCM